MCALASGENLDSRFSLIRPLGHGGMAEVWLVRDHELDEEVAAKIVPAGASDQTIDLLRRECQNARRLAHPNIVRVFDFHRGDERSFITMAFVEGEDLTRLRGGDPVKILKTLIPVTGALEHAHGLGVVHRDLKSDNVLRDQDGQPRVLDFGISAVLAADDGIELAGSGSRYSMSPQQLDGAEPRPADDIYAFGVLLYELVTGHPPLWPEITDERIRSAVPTPMRSAHPLPERLQSLAASMLDKSVEGRPRGMGEIRQELEATLEELKTAPPVMAGKVGLKLTPPPRATRVREISPAPTRSGAPAPPAHDFHRRRMIGAAIVVPLVLIAVAVFVFLPGWVENARQRAPETGSPEELEDAAPAPSEEPIAADPRDDFRSVPLAEIEAQAASKEAAREALERASGFRDRLEERGAAIWAEVEFTAAKEILARGDEMLSMGAYSDAARTYGEATGRFEQIAASGTEVLQELLEEGRAALAAGDAARATSAFTLAATIDPERSAAASGLRRAQVLDELLALMDAGTRAEREGRADDAERSYSRAVELDPLALEAQQALARVRSRISDDIFSRTMSSGLEAMEHKNYAAAREAFLRAEQMRPGRPEVAEALLQIDQSQSLEGIAKHRDQAAAAEAREDWHSATAEYEAILALDSTIRFAQEGKRRCAARAEIGDLIDYHLAHPVRLSTDEVFEEALELLVRASEIDPAGPHHRQRVEALEKLLDAAGAPIPVTLISDMETEVTVYKVGRFGTFERRELALRPGDYTVVGTRSGYRDVRLTLVVRAGTPPAPMIVRCEDPI